MATIEELLALDDTQTREVPVPEWGGVTVNVCSMTAPERAEIERRWANRSAQSDPLNFRTDILTVSLKNGDGKPLGTPDQIKQLMHKNARAIERLFEAACEVSGFSDKDVRELEKN